MVWSVTGRLFHPVCGPCRELISTFLSLLQIQLISRRDRVGHSRPAPELYRISLVGDIFFLLCYVFMALFLYMDHLHHAIRTQPKRYKMGMLATSIEDGMNGMVPPMRGQHLYWSRPMVVNHSGQREVLTVAWPHGCAQGPARRLINEEIFVLWIMRGAAPSQKLSLTSLVFVPPRLTDCLVAGPGSRLAVRRWAGLDWWTEQSRISINYHCYQQSPSSTTSLLAGDRWGFLLALRRYD